MDLPLIFSGLVLLWFVLFRVLPCLGRVYAYCCRGEKNLRAYGEWAVVTGATDGIGKCYCQEFAARGINCLIISRNKTKCEAVEKELQGQYPKAQFSHLAIDFGNFDAAARERVRSKIDGLDVGILVNNVGWGGNFPKYYFENDDEEITGQVEINIFATQWMTKIVLGDEKQGMVARKRGAIVMISSHAGTVPAPVTTCYGAAKAYVTMFTRNLQAEMKNFNIDVQAQTPGRVLSNMTKGIGESGLTWPTAEKYVQSAIRFIGYEPVVAGIWPHAAQQWFLETAPESFIVGKIMEVGMAIRESAFKQIAEEAKAKGEQKTAVEIPLVSVKGQSSSPGMD